MFEPILTQLLDNLNDCDAKIRDRARSGLMDLATCALIGPVIVANHCYEPIPARFESAWKPVYARIILLTELIVCFGLKCDTGLSIDPLLNYIRSGQYYFHSSGDVRDAVKLLVVSINKILGSSSVESILSDLRPKQREEYFAAFDAAQPQEFSFKPVLPSSSSSAHVNVESVNNQTSSHTNVEVKAIPERKKSVTVASDGTTCMFCNQCNPGWSEKDLDQHYWKDCPMLITCSNCSQIIEIMGLSEHLLEECESKQKYQVCNVTGACDCSGDLVIHLPFL